MAIREQLAVAQNLASVTGPPLSDADLGLLQSTKPYVTNNEALLDNQTLYEILLRGYLYLAARGETFARPSEIQARFGKTLKENYPEANETFLRFATTYWTFRLWLEDDNLEDKAMLRAAVEGSLQEQPLVSRLLRALEVDISGLFFPTPGPESVPPDVREAGQRQVFENFSVPIDIEAFVTGNPILIRDRGTGVNGVGVGVEGMTAYYQSGIEAGRRGDYKKALGIFQVLSGSGHADSQYALGVMLYDGTGIRSDYEQAARWYREAALQGHANAQFNLAYIYNNGQGLQQDYHEAWQWNRLAAEQGHARAQYSLALMYADGQGVPQDYAKARQWYERAAGQGEVNALVRLGLLYAEGKGVPQNDVYAYMWFHLAGATGEKTAALARDNFAKRMTPAQIGEAQKLAREWTPKTP